MNEIDYNVIYECSDGKYKIIEDFRKEKGVVLIKFENTGNIQESNYSCAVRGVVIDKNKIKLQLIMKYIKVIHLDHLYLKNILVMMIMVDLNH